MRQSVLIVEALVLGGALLWRFDVSQHHARRIAEMSTHWRPATAVERHGAICVIKRQLAAFRTDNYRAAEGYQSSELRCAFPSAEMFRSVIRASYPQFAESRSVRFGSARADLSGDRVEIGATLEGSDGVTVHALYRLVLEDGGYRVDGVLGGHPLPHKRLIPWPPHPRWLGRETFAPAIRSAISNWV